MADVPGVCELSLTRAVVRYGTGFEVGGSPPTAYDLGIALVIEGTFAAAAEAVDLGSARVLRLDLSGELVVLDWVYDPTLEHVRELVERDEASARHGAVQYTMDLALRVLERIGFNPLSRPILLGVGVRDIRRDLELDEDASIRLLRGERGPVRGTFDPEDHRFRFRTDDRVPDPAFLDALVQAFPGCRVGSAQPLAHAGIEYEVRVPLALTGSELRETLGRMRKGLERLLERYEPARWRVLSERLATFGRRDTLERLLADRARRSTGPDQPESREEPRPATRRRVPPRPPSEAGPFDDPPVTSTIH